MDGLDLSQRVQLVGEQKGLKIPRLFTKAGENVYDTCEWEKRMSIIKNPDGSIVFQMDNVEVPKFWSQTATDILAQKYLRRRGVPQHDDNGSLILDENGNIVLGPEKSLKQTAHRLAGCWRWWGEKFNYFATKEDAQAFEDEMKYMLIHQMAVPNSPQWFNTGLHFAYGITHAGTGYYYFDSEKKEVVESNDDYIRPLAHACFIQTIKDDLTGPGGIMDLWVREAKIFKLGSGSGVNFSNLRAKGEQLSGGGVSSGVMSFLRIGDATAGSIKCVHGEAELVTKQGIKKIKDAVKGDYVLTKDGFKKVLNVFDNGYRELVKVKTSLGFEVVCTPEHRFLVRTADGKEIWKEVKDIGPEDFICIDFSGYEFSEYKKLKPVDLKHHNEKKIKLPEILDEKLGEWLGLIYGDGSVTERRYSAYVGIQIGLEDADMIDKYKKLSKEIFGVHVFENKRKDKRDNSISLRIASKPLIRFLKENDLLKTASNKLFVPNIIKESLASVRASFLRGYFESDGGLVKHIYPSCSSASEKLIKDVQLLLQSIGILSTTSRIDHRENAFGNSPLYKLLVTSFFGIKEFATKISFISNRKKQIMLEGLKSLDNREFEQQWALPYFENDFEKMYAGLSGGKYDIRRATSKYFRETAGKTNFNRFRANRLMNMFGQLKGTFVDALAKSNVYYDKITVEPFGSGHVFDLEVPDGNQYLVNGIVTHNSGGITRRAAKMVILNVDHPEVEHFINWKVKEEKKLAALVEAGLVSPTMEHADEAIYGYQSNNSVRVPDEFMKAVLEDRDWDLLARTTGKPMKTVKASYLWDSIAKAAWACADPGVQYDTTINDWHTCPASGRINASNPCSEFMYLDDTACNLASINLGKFLDEETKVFDVDSYKHVIRLWTIALEITILMAQLPSKEIALNTYKTRSLGLGYTNLGSVLMKLGIPYDSEEARAFSAVITAIMTGESYAASAELASFLGPFEEYEKNKEHMSRVIRNHRRVVYNAAPHEYESLSTVPKGINHKYCPEYLLQAAIQSWDTALALGEKYGYRNAQSTLIAPTGTISLIMDCDTTGIEPDFALVKFKKLAGGGYLKIVNQSVERALKNLGYSEQQIKDILRYMHGTNKFEGTPYINTFTLKRKGFTDEDMAKLERMLPGALELSFVFNVNTLGKECVERLGFRESQYSSHEFNLLKALGFRDDEIEAANEFICGTQTIEGAPYLKAEHYPIFDCANKCGKKGERYIDYMAHVYMMAAAQPLLSGSISKTINMPNSAAVEDVKKVYYESWKLALKSLALYRDGSKVVQPLSVFKKKKEEFKPLRRRLPDERNAVAHKFRVGNTEGYLHVGLFEDGKPGEIFITVAKQGSTLRGLLDSFAQAVSIGLQYGIPLKVWVSKHINNRFEPMGWTDNADIPVAKSLTDYIFKWMAFKFLQKEDLKELGLLNGERIVVTGEELESQNQEIAKLSQFTKKENYDLNGDAPACNECGSMMVRSGSCYVCTSCGATSGCS